MISLLNINLGMSDIVATDNLFHHRVSIMSGNGLQNIAMEEAHPYNNWSDFHIPSVYAYDTIQILPLNMQRGGFPAVF